MAKGKKVICRADAMTQCGKLLGGGRRDAQRPGASRCSTPPPGTRQNRQNLVLAIWSVTWAAAGSGILELPRRAAG